VNSANVDRARHKLGTILTAPLYLGTLWSATKVSDFGMHSLLFIKYGF
jgi:hypothetical protein